MERQEAKPHEKGNMPKKGGERMLSTKNLLDPRLTFGWRKEREFRVRSPRTKEKKE